MLNNARLNEKLPTEMTADVLLALCELCLGSVMPEGRETVVSFIEARNLAGLPAITLYESDSG